MAFFSMPPSLVLPRYQLNISYNLLISTQPLTVPSCYITSIRLLEKALNIYISLRRIYPYDDQIYPRIYNKSKASSFTYERRSFMYTAHQNTYTLIIYMIKKSTSLISHVDTSIAIITAYAYSIVSLNEFQNIIDKFAIFIFIEVFTSKEVDMSLLTTDKTSINNRALN